MNRLFIIIGIGLVLCACGTGKKSKPTPAEDAEEVVNEDIEDETEAEPLTEESAHAEVNEEIKASAKAMELETQQPHDAEQQLQFAFQVQGKKSITPTPEEKNNRYGKYNLPAPYDSRIDIHQLDLKDVEQLNIHKKTMQILCVVHQDELRQSGENSYTLDTRKTVGAAYNLCEDQPFYSQPTNCIGSAFLVGNGLAFTARHVLNDYPLQEYRLIRQYISLSPNLEFKTMYNEMEVFSIKRLVGSQDLNDLDVAVIELDTDESFSEYSNWEDVSFNINDQVYALGHPMGLPMKLTINARVIDKNEKHAYATLDTYQGNSGSPVFLRNSHQLIGILVAGNTDLTPNGGCMKSVMCTGDDCDGEQILRFDFLLDYLSSLELKSQ